MQKSIKTTLALAALAASFAMPADALAPVHIAPSVHEKVIVHVAGGCGIGWHWNRFWHRCVRNR